jgi:hypothetical protein
MHGGVAQRCKAVDCRTVDCKAFHLLLGHGINGRLKRVLFWWKSNAHQINIPMIINGLHAKVVRMRDSHQIRVRPKKVHIGRISLMWHQGHHP